MTKYHALLHFSGGQDSTYVLWKWLTSNPSKKLLVHHVELYHAHENRMREEAKAVKDILQWLQKNGINNFRYHESKFSYGTLPRIALKDIQIIALFTGIILRTTNFGKISKLLLSWHKGEVDSSEIKRGIRVKKILTALDIDDVTFEFPIEHMTREQMAAEMPAELLQLCWTCRRPINARACGVCKTCKELKAAKIPLRR
jgi:hypothetical protein